MESTLTKILESSTGLESLDPFHRAGNRFRKWHDCCYSSLLFQKMTLTLIAERKISFTWLCNTNAVNILVATLNSNFHLGVTQKTIQEKTRVKRSFQIVMAYGRNGIDSRALVFTRKRESQGCVAKLLLFLLEKAGFTEAVEKAVDALMRNLDSNLMKVSCLALIFGP